MATGVFILIAYLIGSLSFAVIVSKAFGLPDPHTYGSGNPGATNVLRTGNKLAAVLTLIGDGAKGWLAVSLAQAFAWRFGVDDAGIAAVVVAAVFAPFFTALVLGFNVYAAAVLAIAVLLVWRHADNIRKLLAGTESRIGQKKSPAVSARPSAPQDPSAGAR